MLPKSSEEVMFRCCNAAIPRPTRAQQRMKEYLKKKKKTVGLNNFEAARHRPVVRETRPTSSILPCGIVTETRNRRPLLLRLIHRQGSRVEPEHVNLCIEHQKCSGLRGTSVWQAPRTHSVGQNIVDGLKIIEKNSLRVRGRLCARTHKKLIFKIS